MKRSEKLLQTIREQELRPIPRAWFTLRNAFVWTGFTLSALLGALAFAVILFCIQQTDFNLIAHLSHSKLELFLGLLPFFWLGALSVFLISAMLSFRQTPRGYKVTPGRLAAYNAGLSILAGAILFLAGAGPKFEQVFDTNLGLYESMQEKKVKLWSAPEQGYLSGVITTANDTSLTLRDFKGQDWNIDCQEAFVAPVVRLEAGEQIKLVGKMSQSGNFKADEIRPWGGPGFRARHNMR